MDTSGHVDWLAATFPATVHPHDTMPVPLRRTTWVKSGKPTNGYRTKLCNELGAVLLTEGEERQGIHLVLTGEVLSLTRSTGVTDRAIIQHVIDNGGKPSRLDLAIDIFNGTLTAGELTQAYTEGRLKTPARSGKRIYGINDTSDGFYLGSRTSERYFRAYNKGAQQGTTDVSWLRLKLEVKNLRARSLAHVIAQEDNTRCVINRAIGDYVQMSDDDELNTVLSDQSGPLPQEGRKVHNTYKWLIELVAPAMARYQAEHMEEDVRQAFLTVYTEELNKLIGTNTGG